MVKFLGEVLKAVALPCIESPERLSSQLPSGSLGHQRQLPWPLKHTCHGKIFMRQMAETMVGWLVGWY